MTQTNQPTPLTQNSKPKTKLPLRLMFLVLAAISTLLFTGTLIVYIFPSARTKQPRPTGEQTPGSFSDIISKPIGVSSPEPTVNDFLTSVKEGNTNQAQSHISQKANQPPLQELFLSATSPNTLLGKQFTANITNTFTEVQGTVSRVDVFITLDSQQSLHTMVLLQENNNWKIVDLETITAATSEGDQDIPQ